MQTLSFQAPDEMGAQIASLAQDFDRSKGYIIRKALESYLEELEDLKTVREYKGKYDPKDNISFDDIKKLHGLK